MGPERPGGDRQAEHYRQVAGVDKERDGNHEHRKVRQVGAEVVCHVVVSVALHYTPSRASEL
jgi:hypothetical protein